MLAARIHDRQLAAFELVAFVRIDLVDHFDHRIAAHQQDALLAIAGEDHVIAGQRHSRSNTRRFFAGALHVKAGLALALPAKHALIKRPHHGHMAEHRAQGVGIKFRIPGPVRFVVIAQHTHKAVGEILHILRLGRLIRARRIAGFTDLNVAEIGLVARAKLRLGHMQCERRTIIPTFWRLIGRIGHNLLSQRVRITRCVSHGSNTRQAIAITPQQGP